MVPVENAMDILETTRDKEFRKVSEYKINIQHISSFLRLLQIT